MRSVNCIIISINIHCCYRLDMVFIYIFFFLLKMSALFHSSKITALVQQLKLHLADLLAKKVVAIYSWIWKWSISFWKMNSSVMLEIIIVIVREFALNGLLRWRWWWRICLQCRRHHETRVQSLNGKDPLKWGMTIHSSILAGESHGQRRLAGYSP